MNTTPKSVNYAYARSTCKGKFKPSTIYGLIFKKFYSFKFVPGGRAGWFETTIDDCLERKKKRIATVKPVYILHTFSDFLKKNF